VVPTQCRRWRGGLWGTRCVTCTSDICSALLWSSIGWCLSHRSSIVLDGNGNLSLTSPFVNEVLTPSMSFLMHGLEVGDSGFSRKTTSIRMNQPQYSNLSFLTPVIARTLILTNNQWRIYSWDTLVDRWKNNIVLIYCGYSSFDRTHDMKSNFFKTYIQSLSLVIATRALGFSW